VKGVCIQNPKSRLCVYHTHEISFGSEKKLYHTHKFKREREGGNSRIPWERVISTSGGLSLSLPFSGSLLPLIGGAKSAPSPQKIVQNEMLKFHWNKGYTIL
jgi:hypothetical protein